MPRKVQIHKYDILKRENSFYLFSDLFPFLHLQFVRPSHFHITFFSLYISLRCQSDVKSTILNYAETTVQLNDIDVELTSHFKLRKLKQYYFYFLIRAHF